MNLADPRLIAKYGSWMRVQVAFYDFLFMTGTELCPQHFHEVMKKGFQDGGDPYEKAVKSVEESFVGPAHAWAMFLDYVEKHP